MPDRPGESHEMGAALASLTGLGPKTDGPLAVSYPSPMMVLSYPLFAANVRILCDKDSWRSRGSSSLATTFVSMQSTYRSEGFPGVYRGGQLFLLHQGCRDLLKVIAERGFKFVEDRDARRSGGGGSAGSGKGAGKSKNRGEEGELAVSVSGRRWRLATKYLIDAICYPLLLASTRTIILHGAEGSSLEHIRAWREQEGMLSLFSGLAASLLSTALEEFMDWVLAWCIEHCSQGSHVELADKMLLRASGSSVVSIFTSPVNYIGVIQRCQSNFNGMLAPEPLPDLVKSLPWRGSMYQFFMFGGIMALNVRLIQWKIQLQNEDDE